MCWLFPIIGPLSYEPMVYVFMCCLQGANPLLFTAKAKLAFGSVGESSYWSSIPATMNMSLFMHIIWEVQLSIKSSLLGFIGYDPLHLFDSFKLGVTNQFILL